MALLLLGSIPPYLQTRFSPALRPNPPIPLALSASFAPQISITGKWDPFHYRRFSPSSAVSGNSTAEAAAAETAEDSGEVSARRRLIAQNIPWTCTAEDIRTLFERHGTVVDIELSKHNSSRNRGLAFITMASDEEALAALNNLNSFDLGGRVIKVEFSRSLKKNPSAAVAVSVEKFDVFVGNLAWKVRAQDLRELFNGNGDVLSAEVIFHSKPRRSAGYGFVSFSSKEAAENAISAFNEKPLMGRPIRLTMKGNQTNDAIQNSNDGEQLVEASNEVIAVEDVKKAAEM